MSQGFRVQIGPFNLTWVDFKTLDSKEPTLRGRKELEEILGKPWITGWICDEVNFSAEEINFL